MASLLKSVCLMLLLSTWLVVFVLKLLDGCFVFSIAWLLVAMLIFAEQLSVRCKLIK